MIRPTDEQLADAERAFDAAYKPWRNSEGDGRTTRAIFISAAFRLAALRYANEHGE